MTNSLYIIKIDTSLLPPFIDCTPTTMARAIVEKRKTVARTEHNTAIVRVHLKTSNFVRKVKD